MVDVPNYALNGLKMKDNGDGTFTLYVIASAIEAALKNEDAPHVSGDAGIQSLAVRKDTAAGLGADGDYVPMIVDANGKLWVNLDAVSALIGALNATKETDPDAASASANALLRGILAALDTANGHLATIATNTAA